MFLVFFTCGSNSVERVNNESELSIIAERDYESERKVFQIFTVR